MLAALPTATPESPMSALKNVPVHAWIVPGSLAVAERPGGGGRSQRVARRHRELAWWQEQGVRTIVSTMRSRHSLVEYARHGFGTRWFPLKDLVQGRAELPRMADEVAELIAREPGAVLVHCDRVSEWLAAVDASLRLRLALADDAVVALEQAEADGMPVGDLARSLMQQEDGPPDGGVAVAA
jgi:hypothetical protein